jgi:hypothetical protein
MPRDNYGFRGDALTPAQAIAIGASLSSQDYQYAVQLGVVTPISDGPTFDNVTNWTQSDTASVTTWLATGSGTSTLAVSNSVAGSSKHGHHYVEFTLASAAILEIDNWQFDGSYPVVSGIDYPCISTSGAFPGFDLDKDGRRRYGLPYRYGTSVATSPIRWVMPAGTWRLEWTYAGNGAATKTSGFNATLSSVASYSKTFTDTSGSLAAYQGIGTDKVIIYKLSGNTKYLRWSPNTTTTVMSFGLASGMSVLLNLSHYDLASGGSSYLLANGWAYDDKNAAYSKTITGPTSITIPAIAASRVTAVIGVGGTTSASFPLSIVS